jgi:hypothetical protein
MVVLPGGKWLDGQYKGKENYNKFYYGGHHRLHASYFYIAFWEFIM